MMTNYMVGKDGITAGSKCGDVSIQKKSGGERAGKLKYKIGRIMYNKTILKLIKITPQSSLIILQLTDDGVNPDRTPSVLI